MTNEATWPLIVMGGLLGSAHCVGMCGPFALTIGIGVPGVRRNLARQLSYSSGRLFTYSFLGATAGFAGGWLRERAGALVNASAALSILAGIVLVLQGAAGLGLLARTARGRAPGVSCLAAGPVRSLLTSPRLPEVFLAGLMNGFLPCGLVYGYLALASAAAGVGHGLLTMLLFGLGTVPLMVAAGLGASLLSHAARRHLFRAAAACVLVTGLLAIGRGAMAAGRSAGAPSDVCVFCTGGR